MAKKQTIAVDVDDVLAASAAGWVAESNARWGTKLAVEDYTEDWATMWRIDNVTTKQRANELFTAKVVSTFDHDAEAVAVLRQLAKRYELVIATSRNTLVRQETLEWLDRHYQGIFSNLHMSGIFDGDLHGAAALTKAELINKIGADYLIDDQIKHCFAVAKQGVEAILFGNYSWNEATDLPAHVRRCSNWLEVGAYFDGQR